MAGGIIIPETPSSLALEARVGRWVGLFDRMTSKSLAVTKAINIAPLCPGRSDKQSSVRLEYTESGDGVSVIFRNDTLHYQVWRNFVVRLDHVEEDMVHAGVKYCSEQIGLSLEQLSQIITDNAPERTNKMAVLVVPNTIGRHEGVRDCGRDINGRIMLACDTCGVFAHSYADPFEDLKKTSCNPNCWNCKALRESSTRSPAVPIRGTCNDTLHTCPFDGNRWWQSNSHFHMWHQVTSDSEWDALLNPQHYGDW